MLKNLKMTNVGPAPTMELEFGNRLNLLTGDNGLGKSFLLDIAWWALTRKWPAQVNGKLTAGKKALPSGPGEASIAFSITGKITAEEYVSSFERQEQAWRGRPGRPANPGLVLYAMADGSFAVWDPARNYWRTGKDGDVQERLPAYVFSPGEVWNGLHARDHRPLCNGLVMDWAGWQKESGQTFKYLCGALRVLSPSESEPILPGELTRISLDDARDIPTLRMPYSQDVPVLHASAGMRRIIALAYVLTWTWDEHLKASRLLDAPPTDQVIFLIDEIESHLHPRWQRRIVRSVLNVMDALRESASVQLIGTTHSPLVLASVEPLFDERTDAWFDLDLEPHDNGAPWVTLRKRPFVRRGDAAMWLTSEAFDLGSARSLEAENVLKEAATALSDEDFDTERARQLDVQLRAVLSDTDPFWMRWRYVSEKKGWLP